MGMSRRRKNVVALPCADESVSEDCRVSAGAGNLWKHFGAHGTLVSTLSEDGHAKLRSRKAAVCSSPALRHK